jgi:hypothetical protein
MATTKLHPVVLLLTLASILAFAPPDRREQEKAKPVFSHAPADLSLVAAVIPLGNVNAVAGGHVRPVNHMYVQYLAPANGGTDSVDVDAMAAGRIVMVIQRQTEACVAPVPAGCAPGGTQMIDEYQIYIQHSEQLTYAYDHLHALDPRLQLPDWQDDDAGWVRLGPMSLLLPGLNGARRSVEVHPGQRMGATRNYFTTWDISVIDTRHTGAFLGSGLLRYPSFHDIAIALIDAGLASFPLGPDEPFRGGMFVNATRFIDYMTPPLGAAWRTKLLGDGSGGRPDWDVADTLQGNWYRSDVTLPTLENILAAEENAVSFSPYNLAPATHAKIGVGDNFFAHPLVSPPVFVVDEARERLSHGLLFTPDRATPGTRHNPDPLAVHTSDYACYDMPDQVLGSTHGYDGVTHSLLVYLPIEAGVVHLKLQYIPSPCTGLLSTLALHPEYLTTLPTIPPVPRPWWGDYVR